MSEYIQLLTTPGVAITLAGVLGLLIGSHLNVVIYRVPRGESISRPPSACPGCAHPVRARDNIPVVSWLALGGECRDCAAPISKRYPAVELATALLFVAVTWWVTSPAGPGLGAAPAYLYLSAIAVSLALIDIDTHRLPDRIVLPSYVIVAVLLACASAMTGDWGALGRSGIGGVGLGALYLGAALAYPGGMGLGDVKLAVPLGASLAWLGWGPLAVGAFAPFLLGGLTAVALMVARRARFGDGVPFGPYMLAGTMAGWVVGEPAAALYLRLSGL